MSVGTTADTLLTRGKYVRIKNLGANYISVGASDVTAAPTAAAQSSLPPVAATGALDSIILRPQTTYYVRAATGATLLGCEELEALSHHAS